MIILKFLKNKYFLTIIGIVVWIIFFDKNDVFSQWELIQKCKELNKEKSYYLAQIEDNKNQLTEVTTNIKSLERLAREKYLMKADNEDVFVFVTK